MAAFEKKAAADTTKPAPKPPPKKMAAAAKNNNNNNSFGSKMLKVAAALSPTKQKKPSAVPPSRKVTADGTGAGTGAPKKVGKLSAQKMNVAAMLPFGRGGPGGGGGGRAGSSSAELTSSTSSASGGGGGSSNFIKPGGRPSKIDIKAGSSIASQADQVQANMSEKAKNAAVAPSKDVDPNKEDWDYLYQLATQYDQYKLQEANEMKNPNSAPQSEARQKLPTKQHEPGDKKNIKNALEGLMGGPAFTVKGDWLTDGYFDQYIVKNDQFKSVTFDFAGQGNLFKRFDRKDAEQISTANKFVEALINHPKSSEITILNMSNALLPDAFFVALAKQCIQKKGLPNVQVMNFESNLMNNEGAEALAEGIADSTVWRRLQILKLENQKMQLGSDAEDALGGAVLKCPSLVVVSLRVQDGLARQRINNSVAANMDKLRQARRQHAAKNGTLKERKRNEMEAYFDKIAANSDPTITDVDIVGEFSGIYFIFTLQLMFLF
jgi:hypothetical protein